VSDDSGLREEPVLAVDVHAEGIVVRLQGELDLYNADRVRSAVDRAIADAPNRLVLDLTAVEFADSTILGVFVDANARLGNGRLRLAAPQLEVTRALRVSGLEKRIGVFSSVADALEH
jgi:anti-sigma B factor antagonist